MEELPSKSAQLLALLHRRLGSSFQSNIVMSCYSHAHVVARKRSRAATPPPTSEKEDTDTEVAEDAEDDEQEGSEDEDNEDDGMDIDSDQDSNGDLAGFIAQDEEEVTKPKKKASTRSVCFIAQLSALSDPYIERPRLSMTRKRRTTRKTGLVPSKSI